MTKVNQGNLETELKQFTGSEVFYRHPLFGKCVYTEGVQYLAEKAGAYWLLDYIFSKQGIEAIGKEEFQAWTVHVQENSSALITLEDGNKNEVVRFHIPFTDFPLKEFTLWFIGGTLLLPGEY